MSVAIDHRSAMRTLLIRVIREQIGLHERLALPLADEILVALQRHYGGQEIRIPAESRADRYQAIRDAHALGASVAQIVRDTGFSRRTVYRAIGGR